MEAPSTPPPNSRVMLPLRRFHRDESGVISLLTVFVMLGCTYLLLWLLNSAKQLDSKVRMQNAVDAAGQSGAGVLARGMNAVAFANHLEADLIAAVVVMRTAQATPATTSPLTATLLPVFEEILAGPSGGRSSDRPISAFRHDVVQRTPLLADEVVRNLGRANGLWRGVNSASNPDGPQGMLMAQLWTSTGLPVGSWNEDDPRTRTLPLIDPSPEGPDAAYLPPTTDANSPLEVARRERLQLVRHYMPQWALDVALGHQGVADRILSRVDFQLTLLLDGLYARSNLPMILRSRSTNRGELERDFMFVAVAYRQYPTTTASRMFRNPNASLAPAMTMAQVHLFVPRSRYVCCPWGEWHVNERTGEEYFISYTDGWPGSWDANTQNWQAKLVPVTVSTVSRILSSPSPNSNLSPATWGELTPRQVDELIHH